MSFINNVFSYLPFIKWIKIGLKYSEYIYIKTMLFLFIVLSCGFIKSCAEGALFFVVACTISSRLEICVAASWIQCSCKCAETNFIASIVQEKFNPLYAMHCGRRMGSEFHTLDIIHGTYILHINSHNFIFGAHILARPVLFYFLL